MEEKLHVIESKMFALTSVLLPREMLSYEPVGNLRRGKHLEAKCDIDLH